MYKPLYWHHGNVKFPDTEVEQVLNEMTELKDVLSKFEKAISSYHLQSNCRPDRIWHHRYTKIVEDLTKSIAIESTSKYIWDYWTQLYFPKNKHVAHQHVGNGASTISFVHFIKPNEENSFRFLDNDGNDYVLPEQNEGDIVFFPSYIWHRVKPLKSGRRLVVAGNIEIQYVQPKYFDLTL